MADANVRITITAVNQASAVIRNAITQLQGVQQALSGVGGGPAARNLSNVNDQVRDLSKSGSGLAKTLTAVATGFAAIAGINLAKTVADSAARVQVLDTVVKQVGVNLGISNQELQATVANLNRLGITAAASRQSLARFLQAGLQISEAAKLARASQDLAVVAGENSSATFQRLITNIQQLDVQGLKFQGIILNTNKVLNDFAIQNGKSAASLSAVEKRQAFLNAVLAESAKFNGAYVESLNSVGKQLTSLPRLFEDLAVVVGQNFLPAYSAAIRELSLFLENARLTVEVQNALAGSATNSANIVGTLVRALASLANVIIENRVAFASLIAIFTGTVGFAALGQTVSFVKNGFQELVSLTGVFKRVLDSIKPTPLEEAGRAAQGASGVISLLTSRIVTLFRVFATGTLLIGGLIAGLIALGIGIKRIYDALKTPPPPIIAEQIITDLKTRTKQIQEAAAELDKARSQLEDDKEAGATEEELAVAAKRVDELRDSYNRLKKENAKVTLEDLKRVTEALKNTNTELADIQGQIADAKELGDTDALSRLEEAFKLAKDRANEYKRIRQEIFLSQLPPETPAQKALREEKKAYNETQQAVEAFQESIKSLFDPQKVRVTSEGLIGVGVEKDITALQAVFENFVNEVVDANGQRLVPSFEQVEFAAIKAFSSISNSAELGLLQDSLENIRKTNVDLANALSRTATYKVQENALKQVNELAEGYLKDLETIQTLLDVQQTTRRQDLELATQEASARQVGLTQTLSSIRNITENEATAARARVNLTEIEYREKLAVAKARTDQLKTLADSATFGERDAAAARTAIDRQSTAERLTLAKDYYGQLNSLAADYVKKLTDAQKKILALDQQIVDSRKSTQDQITAIQRQGLSAEQSFNLNVRDLNEGISQSRAAVLAGNVEEATKLIEKYKALASEVGRTQIDGDFVGRQIGIEGLEDLQRLNELNIARQKELAQVQKKDAVEGLAAVKSQIAEVKAELDSLTDTTAINLAIALDQTSLDAAVALIDNTLGKTVEVRVVPVIQAADTGELTPLQQFAENLIQPTGMAGGGSVRGVSPTSTADNILAALTAGEFVHPVRAVKHYGRAFMESIRTLRFPRYAMGGLATRIPRYATGGAVTDSGVSYQPVTFNFPFGSFDLQADQSTVKDMSKALTVAAMKRRK